MKIRTDYVTNSSSSSFVIAKRLLDEDQIEAIRYHGQLAEKLNLLYSDDTWTIYEEDDCIIGYTYMDNFSMSEFFDIIGVNRAFPVWGEYMPKKEDITEAVNRADKYTDNSWKSLLHEDRER